MLKLLLCRDDITRLVQPRDFADLRSRALDLVGERTACCQVTIWFPQGDEDSRVVVADQKDWDLAQTLINDTLLVSLDYLAVLRSCATDEMRLQTLRTQRRFWQPSWPDALRVLDLFENDDKRLEALETIRPCETIGFDSARRLLRRLVRCPGGASRLASLPTRVTLQLRSLSELVDLARIFPRPYHGSQFVSAALEQGLVLLRLPLQSADLVKLAYFGNGGSEFLGWARSLALQFGFQVHEDDLRRILTLRFEHKPRLGAQMLKLVYE
jgi:hypothetical protein